jgi:hypothetical protein
MLVLLVCCTAGKLRPSLPLWVFFIIGIIFVRTTVDTIVLVSIAVCI